MLRNADQSVEEKLPARKVGAGVSPGGSERLLRKICRGGLLVAGGEPPRRQRQREE
jgi:hypothetical protein